MSLPSPYSTWAVLMVMPRCLLFRSGVDLIVVLEFREAFFGQELGDCRCQRGLAMVNVTDGSDVHVLERSVKFFLCHCAFSSIYLAFLCRYHSMISARQMQ
jgi:hypothetical protein